MFALRRSVAPVSRSVRAFSATPASLKGSKDAKEAAFATAADGAEYEKSYGAGASENKADDFASRAAKNIGDAAKKAAAEVDAQVQSYQDAELGLPQGSGKKGGK